MPHRRLALLRPPDAVRIYLGMNTARRRMVRYGFSPLTPVRTMMEARLYIDDIDGETTTGKRVIAEVTPSWTSEATARRLLAEMENDGTVTIETNPMDRRAQIVYATDKLRSKLTSLFGTAIEEARKSAGEDVYKRRVV